jgi:ribosomal subunit interface protein
MKTLVSVPHHEYPAEVRSHVEQKLQHLLKYYDRIVSLRAVLSRENGHHRVELVANVGHGSTLVVDAREVLLEGAIDGAIDRMGRVLTRHKTRLTERGRRGGRIGH